MHCCSDYFLSDRVYDVFASPLKINLLVHTFGTSNRIGVFEDAVADSGARGRGLTLGVLPYEEAMSLANSSDDIGEVAYLIFGGSARCLSLMFQFIIREQYWYRLVKKQLRLFLKGSRFRKKRFKPLVKHCAKIIAAKLQWYQAQEDKTQGPRPIDICLFIHTFMFPHRRPSRSTYGDAFASSFMAFLARYIREEVDNNSLKDLRRALIGTYVTQRK